MALTQHRMIAALRAANDAKDKLATLREYVRQEAARSDISAEGALANILKAIEAGLFTLSEDHLTILITESAHFARTRARNDRYAKRKALQREGLLPPPQPGADALSRQAHRALLPQASLPLPPIDPSLEELARQIDEDRGIAEGLFTDRPAEGEPKA